MDGFTSIYSAEESASNSSVPSVLNGHEQDKLHEINQLIDDVEAATRATQEGLERELADVREESELVLLQLHQVQEQLEYYFLENQRKDEKLLWFREQRELLLSMLRLQGRFQQRFLALNGRIALTSLRRQLMPWWQRLQCS